MFKNELRWGGWVNAGSLLPEHILIIIYDLQICQNSLNYNSYKIIK